MRTTTAYFAGVGTVVAAVVAGLGGGLLMAGIVNPPNQSAEMTRLEQRMSSKSIPVVNAPSEPVSYLAATQPAASGPITVAPPAEKPPPTAASVAQAASSEQTKSSEDALAKTRNADGARDSDARREARRVEEKRKTERRQQWTERRRNLRRQDQELREVEQKVREGTEPTTRPVQAFAAEPVKMEVPRIRLFGDN